MVHYICIYVVIVLQVSKRNSLNSLNSFTGLWWKNSNEFLLFSCWRLCTVHFRIWCGEKQLIAPTIWWFIIISDSRVIRPVSTYFHFYLYLKFWNAKLFSRRVKLKYLHVGLISSITEMIMYHQIVGTSNGYSHIYFKN